MTESESQIIIVEDNADLRETLVGILTLEGYAAHAASNGRYALQLLQTYPIDLVLSDINMPGMTGIQLLTRIRNNPNWVHIPVIFLSAGDQAAQIRTTKELGADDYLIKPIRSDDLLAAIRGSLRRAHQWRQSKA